VKTQRYRAPFSESAELLTCLFEPSAFLVHRGTLSGQFSCQIILSWEYFRAKQRRLSN